MDAFSLSPGITPTITDIFVVALPIVIGFGYAIARQRGVLAAFAANGIALGLVKVYTDWSDVLDLLVAVFVLAGAIAILVPALRPERDVSHPSVAWRALGAVVLFLGALKIALDFYDPFDVLMADVGVVTGLWLVAGTVRPDPWATVPPTAARAT
ncbi:MAG: hypothetical protein ACREDK_07615 [Thermoplasmata archaeon]